MLNDLKLSLQYILPKLWLTRLAGWGASKRAGWLTKLVIDLFVKYYKVDMKEAQKPDTASYRTFNDFFVRPLRDDIRPLNTDPSVLVMPADGVISQLGAIEDDKILQAKGHNYSLEALLAGNYIMADLFRNGTFATTYLSPRDYHRVHMPFAGTLTETLYVPGELFSVNQTTAENIPGLFARNERMVCLFDTELGRMAVVLVGAMIVAGIETVATGKVKPTGRLELNQHNLFLEKGAELGRFYLGSTAVILFEENKIQWDAAFKANSAVIMGEALGHAV